MKDAVIYARYSSDNQREESIEGQVREINEYAKAKGYRIVHHYVDRALSARTDRRPQFQQMILDSKSRRFQAVLVWKSDRFSRSRYDSLKYRNELKKNGVEVVSITEVNIPGPAGIITEAVLDGINEYYSAELSQKVKRGMKENALKCKANGTRAPFGLMVDETNHYRIDEERAPIVREVFDLYGTKGKNQKDIAEILNAKGIRQANGKPITKKLIEKMLRNRKYIGEYRWMDYVKEDGIPAIVDRKLFDLVQARKEENARAPSVARKDQEYLLTLRLICGECGHIMTAQETCKNGKKWYRWYKCNNRIYNHACDMPTIKKEPLEQLVVSKAREFLREGPLRKRMLDEACASQSKKPPVVTALESQLRDVEKRIGNVVSAIEQGIVSPSTKQRLLDLESQKEELDRAITDATLSTRIYTREEILYGLKRFEDLDYSLPENRRYLIHALVRSVYVFKNGEIAIAFNYTGQRTGGHLPLSKKEGSSQKTCAPPLNKIVGSRSRLFFI